MATRKNRAPDPTKQALLDELAIKRKELERTFTRGELLKDPEYAFVRRLQFWAKKLPEPKKPFVLVTVSGGVASVHAPKGVDFEIIDWDNWDGQLPTRGDIAEMHGIAMRVENGAVRAMLQDEIVDLEGKGLAEDRP